jgi:hypothetical protein
LLLLGVVPSAASARTANTADPAQLIYEDDFSQPTWPARAVQSLYAIGYVRAGLQVNIARAGTVVGLTGPQPWYWGDQSVDVEFVSATPESYAIVICKSHGHSNDQASAHYELLAGPDGTLALFDFENSVVAGGAPKVLAGGSRVHNPKQMQPKLFKPAGQSNRVQLDCAEDGDVVSFRVLVNGKVALRARDTRKPRFHGGGTGLAATVSEKATRPGRVVFQHFTVRDPSGGSSERSEKGGRSAPDPPAATYSDDLSGDKPAGFQPVPGSSAFAAGGYTLLPRRPSQGGYALLQVSPRDLEQKFKTSGAAVVPTTMTVEARAAKESNDRTLYGVVCARQLAERSGYFFGIDNTGFATILRLDETYGLVPLASVNAPSSAIRRASANSIRAVCNHSNPNRVRLRLEVNGKVVLETDDTVEPLQPGLPGIWAEWLAGATRPTITFTDFAMRGRIKSR